VTLFDRLVLTVWLLNAYDAGITICATQHFGVMEFNPLMSACLASDIGTFLAVKFIVMTGVCLALWYQKKRGRRLWVALMVILALFVVVCLWNTGLVIYVAAGLTGNM